MKLDALKNAISIVKNQKRAPSIPRAIKLMEEQEAEKLARIEEAESEKLALIQECVARGKRAAKAEDIADAVQRIENRLKKPRRQPKPKREQKGFLMVVVYKALEKKLRAYSNKGYPHYDQTTAVKELRVVKKYREIIGIANNESVLRGFRKWRYDPLRKRTD